MKYNAIFELMEMLKNADIPFESKEHFDGYLTATDVFNRIKNDYKERQSDGKKR